MNFFFPEWVPVWGQLTLLVLAAVFGICFLLMPFAVFGLKGRLNYVNQQMEDIQAQLRVLLKRSAETRERPQPRVVQSFSGNPDKRDQERNASLNEKKTSAASYIYPLAMMKKRSQPMTVPADQEMRTDQGAKGPEPYTGNETRENGNEGGERGSGNIFVGNTREIYTGHGDGQVYDPPSSSVDEKKEEIIKKRTEPILRWPPK